MSLTLLKNIQLRISPRIFEKIRNGPNRIYSGARGTLIYEKTWRRKSRVRLPLTKKLKNFLFTDFLIYTGKNSKGTHTKRWVSKRLVSKRPVSKRLKRQVYKTSGLQNVRFTKCQVYKTSGLQNVRLQKNIHLYSVLVAGGNPQVLLQPC